MIKWSILNSKNKDNMKPMDNPSNPIYTSEQPNNLSSTSQMIYNSGSQPS